MGTTNTSSLSAKDDLEIINLEIKKCLDNAKSLYERNKWSYRFPDNFGLKYLYHFTDIQNIPSIRVHGILPRADLERQDIPYKPGGDELSLRLDKEKYLDQYVHLSFREFHPMEYVAKCDGRINAKFLKISADILKLGGTILCDRVANRRDAIPHKIIGSRMHIPYEILFNDYFDFSNPKTQQAFATALKSQLLLPHKIDPQKILNL